MGRKTYQKVKHWRYKAGQRAMHAFGYKCGICEYKKCGRALSFHHLDPDSKETKLTGKCLSWNRLVKELRKCVLLCANCHMEVHEGTTNIPYNITKFDESFAVYTNEQGRIIG